MIIFTAVVTITTIAINIAGQVIVKSRLRKFQFQKIAEPTILHQVSWHREPCSLCEVHVVMILIIMFKVKITEIADDNFLVSI